MNTRALPTPEETRSDPATAIVPAEREYHGLAMSVAPAEAKRRLQELQAFVQSAMVNGEDYGVIPGTEKPSLFQPGAQKLAELYGFSHRFHTAEAVKDWERGFFYFEYKCELRLRRDGSFVGEGLGSCNSRESKYAGRWVGAEEIPGDKAGHQKRTGARWVFESELPQGADKRTLKSRTRNGRNGRPYTQFQIIDDQYLIPNPDPYSLVNTIQKMGAKRAYVHAVIAATRSSAIFTQDTEDLPPEAFGEPERRVPAAPDQEPGEDASSALLVDVHATRLRAAPDMPALLQAGEAIEADRSRMTTQELKELKAIARTRHAELTKQAKPDTSGVREPGQEG